MRNALARRDASQDLDLFALALGRQQTQHGLADHLVGPVAEQVLSSRIPAGDDALRGLADHRVVGGFDNGLEQLGAMPQLDPLADVARDLRAPTMRPLASRIGEMVTDTCSRRPLLCRRTVSKWSTHSPCTIFSRMKLSSFCRSGGNSRNRGCPSISWAA